MADCCKSCCGMTGMKVWATVTAALAIAFFSLAVYLPRAIDNAIETTIDDTVTVTHDDQLENTKEYRMFVDPEDPDSAVIYYKVTMFNLKNPAEVLTGVTPDYETKGPYVFRKYQYKKGVTFSSNVYRQELVSYRLQTKYVFEPSMSTGSESDLITNVNLMLVLTSKTPAASLGGLWYLNGFNTDRQRYFTTQNVSNWLWGYQDPIFKYLGSQAGCPLCPIRFRFPGVTGGNEPFFNPNEPLTTQYVGTKPDQALLRTYVAYRGQESLVTPTFPSNAATAPVYVPTWNSGPANRVAGTDAAQFHRHLQEGQTVQTYISQLSRVGTIGNEKNTHVTFKGIDMLKFTLPAVFLGNSKQYAFNGDYNMFGYTGVANLTATGSTEFYLSKPFFLDAAPELSGNLTGLPAANRELHDTYVNIEPITGATMQVAKRLQLSVRITPLTVKAPPVNTTWGSSLPNQETGQYMPIFWVEEYAEISDSSASSFTGSLYGAQRTSMAIYIAGEVIGCVMAVLTVVLFWVSGTIKGDEQPFSVTGLSNTR